MQWREAIKRYGQAHNKSRGYHIEVVRITVVERARIGSGYEVSLRYPADIKPRTSLFQAFEMDDIDEFLSQEGNDPPTHDLDTNAWTETG